MKLRTLWLAGVVALGLSYQAQAAIVFEGAADLGNDLSNPAGSFSAPYTVNAASNTLIVLVDTGTSLGDYIQGITYNNVALTKLCQGTACDGIGNETETLWALSSPATGHSYEVVVTLTPNAPPGMAIKVGAADYAGMGALESLTINPVAAGATSITTSVTALNSTDWAVIGVLGYSNGSCPTAGAGDIRRTCDGTYGAWGLFDSNGALSVGSHSFTTNFPAAAVASAHLVAVFKASTSSAVPTAISCAPTVPTLTDAALSGATVCMMNVTMSDGSVYTGSNVATPSLFTVPASGTGGNVTISRNLAATDDGLHTAAVTATQNGGSFTADIPVNITAASVTGTPFSFGWKNIDPGSGVVNSAGWSTDGETVMIAPHTYTVAQVLMQVVNPTSSQALVDVYQATPGQACSAGLKLHSGDFNVSQPMDHPIVLPLSSNTALGIQSRICVITKQPFPTNGQAFVEVTLQ